MPSNIILAFVLVPHRGYINFFDSHKSDIMLIDPTEFPELKEKEIFMDRYLAAPSVKQNEKMLQALFPRRNIFVLTKQKIRMVTDAFENIIMPDEEISRYVGAFFPQEQVSYESIFVRVDRNVLRKDVDVKADVADIEDVELFALMDEAEREAMRSSDWWRQVGCLVITADGQKLLAHNHHLPHEQITYVKGDPRSCFNAGVDIHITYAVHAEASIIANAARQKGVSLEGATLFTTTFPCPLCAKYIAESGVATVYFKEGYSLVDAQEILESKGVKIFRLKSKEVV
ncbi:MAG TPA: deaminase [Candidatus Paceibacterota bacterium]|nr:deaminase [Candidatus Paceibacterota bacterium]